MAIYHFNVQIIGRSKGRSSVACAAYRAGELLKCEYDGMVHDYRPRGSVVFKDILAPISAPEWVYNREKLWNNVELAEKRKDAQLAREIDLALPRELSLAQQKDLLRSYVSDNFVSMGMIADIAIHDSGDGNPHGHIMLTTRDISTEGFGLKNRSWNAGFASAEMSNFTSNTSVLVDWRARWAEFANRSLCTHGYDERIDHRSYVEQDIDLVPTIHEGISNPQVRRVVNSEIKKLNSLQNDPERMKKIVDHIFDLKQGTQSVSGRVDSTETDTSRKEQNVRIIKLKGRLPVMPWEQLPKQCNILIKNLKIELSSHGAFAGLVNRFYKLLPEKGLLIVSQFEKQLQEDVNSFIGLFLAQEAHMTPVGRFIDEYIKHYHEFYESKGLEHSDLHFEAVDALQDKLSHFILRGAIAHKNDEAYLSMKDYAFDMRELLIQHRRFPDQEDKIIQYLNNIINNGFPSEQEPKDIIISVAKRMKQARTFLHKSIRCLDKLGASDSIIAARVECWLLAERPFIDRMTARLSQSLQMSESEVSRILREALHAEGDGKKIDLTQSDTVLVLERARMKKWDYRDWGTSHKTLVSQMKDEAARQSMSMYRTRALQYGIRYRVNPKRLDTIRKQIFDSMDKTPAKDFSARKQIKETAGLLGKDRFFLQRKIRTLSTFGIPHDRLYAMVDTWMREDNKQVEEIVKTLTITTGLPRDEIVPMLREYMIKGRGIHEFDLSKSDTVLNLEKAFMHDWDFKDWDATRPELDIYYDRQLTTQLSNVFNMVETLGQSIDRLFGDAEYHGKRWDELSEDEKRAAIKRKKRMEHHGLKI